MYCIVYIGSSGNPTGPHIYITAYSMMSKQYQKTFNRLATTSECGIISGTALLPSVRLLYKTASEAVKSKDSVPLGWNAAQDWEISSSCFRGPKWRRNIRNRLPQHGAVSPRRMESSTTPLRNLSKFALQNYSETWRNEHNDCQIQQC